MSTPPGASVRVVRRTEGSIVGAVLSLALPAMGGMISTILFNLVDAIFVGRLGPAPLAAISASAFLYWAMQAVGDLPTLGGRARVARAVGADDGAAAQRACAAAVGLGLALGLAVAFLGLTFLDRLFDFMRVDPEVHRHGRAYLGILFAGVHGVILLRVGEGLLQGSGDARSPMLIHAGALVLNIILDPLLIFGPGPLPALGVRGAAIATVVTQVGGAATALVLLTRRGLLSPSALWRTARHRMDELLQVARIGAPIGALGLTFSGVYLLLTRVVTGFGTPAVAALGIGHRVESVNYLVSVGFAAAAASLVGQNLGADQVERAGRTVRVILTLGSSVLAVVSVIMLVAAEAIAGVFVDDPETVALAATYLRIVAVCQVFQGWWVMLEGAFSGAGRTLIPMLVVLPAVLGRVPLAQALAVDRGLGVEAVWWILSATALINGLLLVGLWARRQWAQAPSAPEKAELPGQGGL